MTIKKSGRPSLFNSKRGRILLENLTAYAFLAPSMLLIFIFGIFPVAFAFYVSLYEWRRFPGDYLGLGNYERALGNFSYVLFFWLAAGAVGYALFLLYRLWQEGGKHPFFLIPGVFSAGAVLAAIQYLFALLPVILNIPQRVRGQDVTRDLFMGELINSFQFPEVIAASNIMLVAVGLALVISLIFHRLVKTEDNGGSWIRATMICLFLASAFLIFQLTYGALDAAVIEARETGEELPVWSQIILISLGAALFITAYFLWQRAHHQFENRRFLLMLGVAFLMMFGGYLLVVHVPSALASADDNMLSGFNITVMYSLGTVPLQLGLGMVLAYMLFQNIRGKTLFRIIYFLPYIMPFAATSVVFRLLFSNRPTAPINNFIAAFGIEPLKWLLEPKGIFELMFPGIPDFLAGPGLALVVIMIYGVWTYVGYDAVVFLAGLGNIQPDLYEAARIDGAGRWQEFRYITFPLLSPTTFFLSLIAIIGTFQAFTQIWIMRNPAASRAVDTVGVYIYETISTNSRLGYGSAMAFVLFIVILVLTILQNRVVGRRVFYG